MTRTPPFFLGWIALLTALVAGGLAAALDANQVGGSANLSPAGLFTEVQAKRGGAVYERGTKVDAAPTEDAYRLARYASVEHWRATRDSANAQLGGNGPSREKSAQSGRDRTGAVR